MYHELTFLFLTNVHLNVHIFKLKNYNNQIHLTFS